MELRSVRLKNFRGYRDIKIQFSGGLQILVGKNDIGKSTVFEALDIFFNGKDANVKLSIDDFNVAAKLAGENEFSVTCEFELTGTDEICIETVKIDPSKEYLLNANGYIEIKKQWSLDSLKDVTYINCNVPQCIPLELLTAKQTDLKKKIKELKLESQCNQTTNSSMRQALYRYFLENTDSIMEEHLIQTKNALSEKDIYENISRSFPDFYLFKADRKNSTSDDEVQNPMSIAVKRAFECEDIVARINEIEGIIINQLNQINQATIEKLSSFGVECGNSLNARISANWVSAIKNDILDGDEVPINKRGSGVRRLLLLSYLMAEADKKSFEKNKKNIIYAIEEPETALHPMMQNKFIEQLLLLSKANRFEYGDETPSNADELKKYQVFITTHLPNFVSYANYDQIIYLHKSNESVERYGGDDLKEFIQKEMGRIPIIDYKYVVFVEGENDISALRNLGNIPELKSIFDINSQSINLIPLLGSNLLKCIELDYFWDLPVKQYHLYDGDVLKYKTEIIDKRCNKDENKKIRGAVTILKEMENYIPRILIETKLGLDLTSYADKWNDTDFDIVNTLLAQRDTSVQQFNSIKSIKDSKRREKALKCYLSKTILSGVTKDMLVQENLFDEIESWFKSMKSLNDYME